MRRSDRQIREKKDMEAIISKSDVCRIAFANGNIPYIVTMNFGYMPGKNPCFYFHCAREGRKIEMMRKNNHVCFEIDTDHEIYRGEIGCDWGMNYSSVVGYGIISEVIGKDSRKAGLDCIMSHYSDAGKFTYDEKVLQNTRILRLDVEEMNGKRKT